MMQKDKFGKKFVDCICDSKLIKPEPLQKVYIERHGDEIRAKKILPGHTKPIEDEDELIKRAVAEMFYWCLHISTEHDELVKWYHPYVYKASKNEKNDIELKIYAYSSFEAGRGPLDRPVIINSWEDFSLVVNGIISDDDLTQNNLYAVISDIFFYLFRKSPMLNSVNMYDTLLGIVENSDNIT